MLEGKEGQEVILRWSGNRREEAELFLARPQTYCTSELSRRM